MQYKHSRITSLVKDLENLTNGQIYLIEKIVNQLKGPHRYNYHLESDLVNEEFLENFGDGLRIHHCFSSEAFSKDKFEYLMERVANMSGFTAHLAPKGNPGHDITINNIKTSLKTEAAKAIKIDEIHISKFMELGKGNWGNDIKDLKGLRDQFFNHMSSYDRIFTLRLISRAPRWHYELVEIPKELLMEARFGEFEMMFNSKQFPKPGYCRVFDKSGQKLFELYFDGGGERKLQIKHLLKDVCIVHAEWIFEAQEIL
jgi:hypothetical protein